MKRDLRVLIDGPISGSYSLAVVNREIAKQLLLLGLDVYLTQREGPDVLTDPFFLAEGEFQGRYIEYADIENHRFDVHSKFDWPVFDTPKCAPLMVCHCYAWEEPTFPTDVIAKLDNFDAIFTISEFTNDALRSSGYTGFLSCIHCGIDHLPVPATTTHAVRSKPIGKKDFRFLHISSGLPRKGMDQGIKAFAEEFAKERNVKLYIKTHSNYENNIYSAVESLSQKDREKIELSDRFLSNQEIAELISTADFCYFPSRGEGFLMPAAEAMNLGVPVCVTACGGNAAFCTDATSILVPTKLARSSSRISSGRSAWFEAETSDLRAALRRAYELKPQARQALIESARSHIAQFKWSTTARHFAREIETLIARRTNEAPQIEQRCDGRSVAIISTFNQKCGIATFARSLSDAFSSAGIEHTIISERIDSAEIREIDEANVFRLWKRDHRFANDIIAHFRNHPGRDIVVQHHPGIISWEGLRNLVVDVKPYSKSIVVELHSTEGLTDDRKHIIQQISESASIIVHNSIDYINVISNSKTHRNIFIFPHAVPQKLAAKPGDLQRTDSGICVFSFGLCGRHKQFETILRIVHYLKMQGYKASGKIITSIDARNAEAIKYGHDLWVYRQMLDLEADVELIFDFLPLEQVSEIAQSCSIAVFPYADVREGASGAARVAMAAGIPVLLSDSSIFDDLRHICQVFKTDQIASIANSIATTLENPQKSLDIQSNYMKFATWDKHMIRILHIIN